ncbi:MAG TPA: DUF3040 domain-containing protein [Acidimicrobiia bacterium]|nr:DUF3040 domain-containing protein [Acidimicrobiia bacterium]
MPLSDREQKILAEIERHFHAEDPNLVRAVRRIDRIGNNGSRWATVGVVLGLVLVAVAFSRNTIVAVAGFVLVVWSANYLVQKFLTRQSGRETESEDTDNTIRNKGRRRFRRD